MKLGNTLFVFLSIPIKEQRNRTNKEKLNNN